MVMLVICDRGLKVILGVYLALRWADNPLTFQDIGAMLISHGDGG